MTTTLTFASRISRDPRRRYLPRFFETLPNFYEGHLKESSDDPKSWKRDEFFYFSLNNIQCDRVRHARHLIMHRPIHWLHNVSTINSIRKQHLSLFGVRFFDFSRQEPSKSVEVLMHTRFFFYLFFMGTDLCQRFDCIILFIYCWGQSC